MKKKNNIIAHRGIHNNKDIPENSLTAFKLALEKNYAIELDIQLTSDNKLVVFHDYDLKRLSKKNNIIQKTTYNELKQINLLNTKEKIPTLQEVLKLVNSKVLLDIEIKNTNRIEKTCKILMQELKDYQNFILKSFNPKIVRYLKKKYPNVKVGYLIANNYNNWLYDKLFPSKLILNYLKPDFLAIDKKLLNNQKFMKKTTNKQLYVWTITNKNEIKDKNNTYICNNLPY